MNTHVSDRLGPLDSLFLYLEKKEMPLHIGSVFVFDGPIPFDDLKSLIEAKLPLVPRYRQRLLFPPFQAGYPTWEYDPDFDIDRHIQRAVLETGTKEELETLAGQRFSEMMDRNRPLWDLTVVDGLQNGRSALIARVHHCLVDGIAGVALMKLILDDSPAVTPLPAKQPFHPPSLPDPALSLVDALASSYFHTVNRVLSLQSAAANLAEQWFNEFLGGALGSSVGSLPDAVPPRERFPFYAPSLGPRRVAWAEFPMADIFAIHDACGVKVNDVGMMILAGAVQRYAHLHHVSVKNRPLRLMVPVNLRAPDQHSGLGNRISLVPVNVPLDITDPLELLNAIHQRSDGLKHIRAADAMVLGGSLLALLPVPTQALLVGQLSNNVSVLPFDMVCTNVPGPQRAVYLFGREMLTYYPYVPIGDFMGVNCAMVSYNGTLYFGLTGDCACAPDLDRLRDFLNEAFEDVRKAAGVAPVISEEPQSEPLAEQPVAEPTSEPVAEQPVAEQPVGAAATL